MTRLPYAEISAMARVEAHRKNIYRPPYYVHKWWARRTGSVFRGLLLDLLLPPGEDLLAAYYRAHRFDDVTILDPFMGGGTTIGEGLRLGCKMVGCDLNPVAWYLVTQAMREVDLARLDRAFQEVGDFAADKLTELYATTCSGCDGPAVSQYVAWIKQVPCGKCGKLADLNASQVIMADMATEGAGLVDCPSCSHAWWVPSVHREVVCPHCDRPFKPSQRLTRNTDYHCNCCGHEDRILTSLREAEGPPTHRMRCLVIWCERCGKRFQAPSDEDLRQFGMIASEVATNFEQLRVPREEIPSGYNTNQMRRYGYRYWHQMFNPRQLVALALLFSTIRRLEDQGSREVLTLLASSSLELNSMFCGAKGLGTGAIRHVFAHHAFIPAKEPLEANVWGVHRSSGGFSTLYKERLLRARAWAAQPIERRFTGSKAEKTAIWGERLAGRPAATWDELQQSAANMLLLNHSSESLPEIPDDSVDFIVTDPPYADNVMYSELSDYFYVWLRQALKEDYPNFNRPAVDDEREAVHNPARGRDAAFYTSVITSIFAEARRILKPSGRLAFTFHHAGQDAWRSIETALIQAGYVVERWWPIFAEMESAVPLQGKNNNGHLDIVFVCAKQGEISAPAEQDSPGLMLQRLTAKVTLVPADHRAVNEAAQLQAATWAATMASEVEEVA